MFKTAASHFKRGLLAPALALAAAGTTAMPVANAQTVASTTNKAISNMDSETQLLIQYAVSTGQPNFAVVSKANARIYIVNNGQVIRDFPVGLGKDKFIETAAGFTHHSGTPSGRFGVQIMDNRFAYSLSGKPVIAYNCMEDMSACLALHSTYLGEFDARQAKLNSPTPTDNYFSNGCINARPQDMEFILQFFRTHSAGNNEHVRPFLYVMPYDVTQTRSVFGIPSGFGASSAQNLAYSPK